MVKKPYTILQNPETMGVCLLGTYTVLSTIGTCAIPDPPAVPTLLRAVDGQASMRWRQQCKQCKDLATIDIKFSAAEHLIIAEVNTPHYKILHVSEGSLKLTYTGNRRP